MSEAPASPSYHKPVSIPATVRLTGKQAEVEIKAYSEVIMYGHTGPAVNVDPWALLKRWLQFDHDNHEGDTLLLLVEDTQKALSFACVSEAPKLTKLELATLMAMQGLCADLSIGENIHIMAVNIANATLAELEGLK